MTDYMNREQYRKACLYRARETLENLMGAWEVEAGQVDSALIALTMDWLHEMAGELNYFDEKIKHGSLEEARPGFVPER